MSATPAAEPEIFAMRRPQSGYEFSKQKSWEKLKEAIAQNGGRVVEVQGSQPATEHDVMFVRDAGVVINDPAIKTPTYVLPRHKHIEGHASGNDRYAVGLWNEGEAIAKTVRDEKKLGDSKAKLAVKHIYGTMEGGNVVIDPKRHKIFVGTSIRVCLRDKGPNPTDADKERYLGFEQRAINELQALLKTPEMQLEGGGHYEVVPLRISDATCSRFYHLDGCLNVLPTGQVVVYPGALTKTAMLALEGAVGKGSIMAIAEEEAIKGATNFITVGEAIITPHASARLAKDFQQLGYKVVQPTDMGLTDGSWMFNEGGAVRCATLKVTPDRGYPAERALGKGRVQGG